nr:geranylgeranyl transferase type-2 subunit alpha [Quercus suber]
MDARRICLTRVDKVPSDFIVPETEQETDLLLATYGQRELLCVLPLECSRPWHEVKSLTKGTKQHGIPRAAAAASRNNSEEAREKERKQIEQYKRLEQDVVARVGQNPEYYTIWNHRRRLLLDVFKRELESEPLVESQDVSAAAASGLTPAQREISLLITEDLQFLVPLLRQYPKCYWIWNHRSWLLSTATINLPASNALELWKVELGLVGKMLGVDSRNFHGWGYRRRVVEELERLSGKSMTEQEYEYTTKMIHTNLSNFSAWHARSQLIPRLLNERAASTDARKRMLDNELELITTALYTDAYDQSLWFYHQYLMATLEDDEKLSILQPCSSADRRLYLEQELDSIMEMLDGAEDCKYIYQALLEYSARYMVEEAENSKITKSEMGQWLQELRKIDPLREGRWKDLEKKLGI